MDPAGERNHAALAARTGGGVITEAQRMRFILATMALTAGGNIFGAMQHGGPRFALFIIPFNLLVLLAWTVLRRDPVIARWLLLAFVAGCFELATDAWLVKCTGTLVYPPTDHFVWDSPVYMPFSWTVVLTQLGVVGGWFAQRMSLARATLACALLGGSMIPLYEHLAYETHSWWYRDTPMLFHAPLYIIVSEFLLSLPLVWMYGVALARPWRFSAALGALAGLWMLPSVMFAFKLVGPCHGAWIQFACS